MNLLISLKLGLDSYLSIRFGYVFILLRFYLL